MRERLILLFSVAVAVAACGSDCLDDGFKSKSKCPDSAGASVSVSGSGSATDSGSATATDSASATDSGSATATDSVGTASASGSGTDTASGSASASGSATETAGTATATASGTATGGDGGVGDPCNTDDDCGGRDGLVCCTEAQCLDTCMVPCKNNNDCPDPYSCIHDHCFWPCDDNDDDCVDWPDYTCQHGGEFCEVD